MNYDIDDLDVIEQEIEDIHGVDGFLWESCHDQYRPHVQLFDWVDIANDYKAGILCADICSKYSIHWRILGQGLNLMKVPRRGRLKGVNHPNWKNGITSHNQAVRASEKTLEWRIEVFKSDNFRCRRCNSSGRLNAHHIYPFATYLEKRFDVHNGITLCKPCHKEFHRLYGRNPENPQEKIAEFIMQHFDPNM